ncbi:MAG: UDP-N-acetylmuramoylalanyl-D-glutamyl-2,6-diaminopimelate--D-alanyl-D-alanine ligase [Alphaproteobacteria bacterium]|nr:UDP-N-acetylmuramoylalanyl-D-glutamyl-2,6-diaminopimelate--D-alanyl-D-alanine ligase [Alphaproteobacteria bacterium]
MSAESLWTASEAARATAGRGTRDWAASGVSIDSRAIGAGELFVALEGPNFDGHDFVAEALAKGAAAAVVSRVPEGLGDGGPLLVVDDTMAALNGLAAAARARGKTRVIAVTGSVGKTGTKEALGLALTAQAATHVSVGNLNNPWGVPLSLARMPRDADFAVLELGMNGPGELGPLSRLVRPHVALITAVEAVHLEFFASVEAIAEAKAEVFEGLEPDGVAVLNRDSPHYERLSRAARQGGAARVVDFGANPRATARLVNVALHPDCCCVSAEVDGQAVTYKVGAPGRHWAMNSLAVLAVVRALDADLGLAALSLAAMTPPAGRGRRHRVTLDEDGFELIDDSYNASPAAMRAAFEVLARTPVGERGRRVAVLGDMLELGAEGPALHQELAQDLVRAGVDLVFAAGPAMARLFEALPAERRGVHAASAAEVVGAVRAAVRPGDAVLVKGSLGSRMGLVVEALLALHKLPRPRAVNG